jgi:hypothetical protein
MPASFAFKTRIAPILPIDLARRSDPEALPQVDMEPAIGFEPMTYRLQVGCASGLRHAGGTGRVYPRRNAEPDTAIA